MNRSAHRRSSVVVDFDDCGAHGTSGTTLLYSLKPFGIGTSQVEGLRSYVERLAYAHRVSVISIMNVFYPKRETGRVIASELLDHRVHLGLNTQTFCNALKRATGRSDVEFCTLLPLSAAISDHSLASEFRRFCPLCCEEGLSWQTVGTPLLWSLNAVSACPLHKVTLLPVACRRKRQESLLDIRRTMPRVCPGCGSIGYACSRCGPAVASEIEVYKAEQVGHLLSELPKLASPIDGGQVAKGVRLCIERQANGSLDKAATSSGIPKSLLWAWYKSKNSPGLGKLLQFCLGMRVGLTDLLVGRCTPAHSQPVFCLEARRPRRQLICFEARKSALLDAIGRDAPPSVAELNTALGLSDGALDQQFPHLTRRLARTHLAHRAALAKKKREKVDREFRTAVAGLIRAGAPVTRRNIERVLGKPMPPWSAYRQLYKRFRADS
jgi:hypothetical protein